ncbi:glycoside hydrolase family 9 protein [Dyadobacter fanqingshengii]|uniref:Endoglucanase n=1 Tax=Dyadobacter fanqingshengii TaxID=2906443 RepID=A0A9X1P8I7_9BACT|nr:glycoside hydrolase family 9 protein [Dyadobacter fanqingshengii]MCF0039977.1 glycoside hydrolase family 9 protein [Dyadobacter fanqingshengii]USJ38269.1 glycoside hydrolase family 9 protein [Dyadobacter fanqingshengii]
MKQSTCLRNLITSLSFCILSSGLSQSAFAQNSAEPIRLNQIGFYPNAQKIAIVIGEKQTVFELKEASSGKTVLKGKLSEPRTNQHSGKISRIADFSSVRKAGKYFIEVPALGKSAPFEIKEKVYKEVAAASLKGFYYQRVSTDLPEKFAGKWARPAGHPDNKVLIHASAASESRPENAVISSPKGWYDAGDYNKYIVNSGITIGTLLSLYEDYPSFCENFMTNIPESNNGVPDVLDEALWNLRWMLTMQDPADGGVYHKLTNPRFDGMIMPDACKNPRYVVQKGTAATLDFVAVMAQSARILKNFENKFPGLSDSCVTAAVKGWEWAKKNPAVLYNQDEMNKKFDPDVVTGAYGDRDAKDEWIWAAAEMYALTKKPDYLKDINFNADQPMPLPTWSQVKTLGYYTMIRFADELKTDPALTNSLKKNIISFADNLLVDLEKQPYHTVMGKTARDYSWGSSSVAANQGIALLYAFKQTKNPKYVQAAQGNLDYLLGRNATGYCFLTGFGSKRVMHPHHRPSVADGIADPVPGLLSGGPNPAQQDKCTTYTSKFADESFTDDDCSYASNEISINWNAPMVYLSAALEALSEMK